MAEAWQREEEPARAEQRILDAAEKAFIELGVSNAGMGRIAEAAGCSRGTLYRYFPNRHALHLAYIERAAQTIVERVRDATSDIEDPRERLVESILRSVAEVRANPGTAAWFEPGIADLAARMSRSSEMIDTLTVAFTDRLRPGDAPDAEGQLQARWFVRVIVSLLTLPEATAAEERALVERFVVPSVFGTRSGREADA